MKDHVEEKRYFDYPFKEPIDQFIGRLKEKSEGLINPVIDDEGWDGPDLVIIGWRPMTSKELEKAKKRRAASVRAARARKEKKEKAERAELERLKAKYG